ncbi:hypothetical protein KPB01_38775, partial [Burkholderia sola]|nr:hypothetical protein [Burkholderia sola]
DLEHLVDVLHLLRPDSAEFAFFDGCSTISGWRRRSTARGATPGAEHRAVMPGRRANRRRA